MRLETGLTVLAAACAAVAPCTFGVSVGVGVPAAVAGIVVARRNARSVVAPVLALAGNVLALAMVALLALLAALTIVAGTLAIAVAGAVASIEAIEQVPHAARSVRGALAPAGFWDTYRHDELLDHDSSQGPWGGSRFLHWHATGDARFDADEVLQFAIDHGWRMHSRGQVRAKELYTWHPPCVLPSEECREPANHSDGLSPEYLGLPKPVRRQPSAEFTVMTFDTGWVQFPDFEDSVRTVVGFASISADGRDLYVAHHWGE